MAGCRDIQLDMYRGLVMIYILCVIHVAYWLNLADEPWRSIILFEMPLIFFISGASVSMASTRHNVRGTVWSRFKRVLLPYYAYIFYSVILICIVGLLYFVIHGDGFNIDLSMPMLVNALIPQDEVLNIPYMYHLWFVIPYLIISCAFPLFRGLIDRLHPVAVIGVLFLSCLLVQFVSYVILREIVIYGFFFVAGYLFYKKMKLKNIIVTFLVSACVVAICVGGGNFIPLQLHKFPPDLIFLMYGVAILALFGIIFTYLKLPQIKLLMTWNKRGYTLYLWQNYFFTVVAVLAGYDAFAGLLGDGIVRFVGFALLVFVVSISCSGVLVWLENAFVVSFGKMLDWMSKLRNATA